METRQGCSFCFETLDSNDNQPVFRNLVQCKECGSFYHRACWKKSNCCVRCNGSQVTPIDLFPPPLPGNTKRESLPIEPSAISYSVVGLGFVMPDSVVSLMRWYYTESSDRLQEFISSEITDMDGDFSKFVSEHRDEIVPVIVIGIPILCLLCLLVAIF